MNECRRVRSERLQAVVDLVRPGETVADIGTDHARIPIDLLQTGRSPRVILTDSKAGPLQKAKQNIEAAGLCIPQSDIRRGSGLRVLDFGEVSVVIIAGMGGRTMEGILLDDPSKTSSFGRFILQPQSHSELVRRWVTENGYIITSDFLCRERHRFCEIIEAERADEVRASGEMAATACDWSSIDYEISPVLFAKRDRLLPAFLDAKIAESQAVLDELSNEEGAAAASRRAELTNRIKQLQEKVTLL